MKRFIYKKVVTGLPNTFINWWAPTSQPRPVAKRHVRRAGYFALARPADAVAEPITLDKWAPTYPVMRRRTLRNPHSGMVIDPNFFAAVVDPAVVPLDRWYAAPVQPRRRARTLTAPYIPAGLLDHGPIIPGTTTSGVYRIKIFASSRKTDL